MGHWQAMTLHWIWRKPKTPQKWSERWRKVNCREWPKSTMCLERWHGSKTVHATEMESRAQNKQMTAVGYIADTEDILKSSWSNFQLDGAAACTSSERSPLAPALSAQDLNGGRTKVLNLHKQDRIDCHPAIRDEHNAPESLSDAKNLLDWNCDLDNPMRVKMAGRQTINPV